ncbi:amidohydrolase [Nocardioides sp. GY 10113]|uniref:amidohydrolase n=1 Tax=Nocardioides sp. GY 10113 TaxID=2569761 RepID=UPI0010A7CB32|nr:amidohydrolase family protein [Nocardioides sp. GY 10113]TIC83594.1 amidohydrolase [Nocardioides sp. GY 10113]
MPDLLIRGARLVPVTPEDVAPERPVDVLISAGRVTEIGAGVTRPSGIEEIDADGRWLMPGLWDHHVHLGQWSLATSRTDTGSVGSVEEMTALVADLVAARPGMPVIGWGHRPATWPREGSVADLDAVSGITPVVLIAGDGHHAWLNSAALAALDLAPREGVVAETEWYAAYALLTRLTADSGAEDYRSALRHAAAHGVVGLVDFEFVGDLDAWRGRWHDGCDLLRVRAATYADGLEAVLSAGLRTGDPLLPGDDRLTMGPLKIISDGSLNTRTAWCHDHYLHGAPAEAPAGAPNLSGPELTGLLARAHAHGLEVATHAIGDAALEQALASYRTTGARGSVEHVQLMRREQAGALAALRLRASVQPAHLIDDRDLIDVAWADRAERSYAFRWLLDAGAALHLGSDAPVAPLDPWLAIDAAVRRTGDERSPWHPEQALSRAEALAASTDGRPMVGVGAPADLVVLEEDPLTQTRPPVALTVVAGRVVHRA